MKDAGSFCEDSMQFSHFLLFCAYQICEHWPFLELLAFSKFFRRFQNYRDFQAFSTIFVNAQAFPSYSTFFRLISPQNTPSTSPCRHFTGHRQVANRLYDSSLRLGLCVNVHRKHQLCADRWNGHRQMVIDHWNIGFVAASASLYRNGRHSVRNKKLATFTTNHFDAMV